VSSDLKTLIFDLDGTLADTLSDLHNAINEALRQIDRPEVSRQYTQKAVGPGKAAFLKAVLPEGDDNIEVQFLECFRKIYWDNCLKETSLYPGIDRVLNRFSDRKLAVATNKPRHFSEKILSGLGVLSFFQLIVGPDDVTHAKPHPEMLFKILNNTDSQPSSTLFIGDTVEDMKAGKSAGLKFCRAPYGYGSRFHLEEIQPECSIFRPVDLMDMVPAFAQKDLYYEN